MRPAHRRWHRRAWIALAFVVPFTFLLAASTRARRPAPKAVPSALGTVSDGSGVTVRFTVSPEPDGSRRLSVRGERLDAADPLLYWTADSVASDWEPDSGIYLGPLPLSGRREFLLSEAGGQIVGYDLATHRVLFVNPLPGDGP